MQKRLRFTQEDKTILLREVLSINPFEEAGRWILIQEILKEKTGKLFSIRALKEHLELLMKKFIDLDNQNKNKTGIEEPYNEYNHMLQQIKDLTRDFKTAKVLTVEQSSKSYIKDSMEKEKQHRLNCLNEFKKTHTDTSETEPVFEPKHQLNPTEESEVMPVVVDQQKELHQSKVVTPRAEATKILTPSRQRQSKRLKNSSLEFLTVRQEREHNLKIKELDLEARRLDLEERKMVLEEKKLLHQIDMDKKRLEAIKVKMEQADKKNLYEMNANYHKSLNMLLEKM